MKNTVHSALATTLLGAAALLTFSAAQAADLPSRKAEPASYVRICDAYGAGFFVIPGTDTCARFTQSNQITYWGLPAGDMFTVAQPNSAGKSGVNNTAVAGAGKNATYTGTLQAASTEDTTGSQADIRMGMDSRTPTAYGTLRTAIGLRFKFNSGVISGNGPSYSITGGGGSENKISIDKAYVQYLGFTAGFFADPFTFYYEDDDQTQMIESHGSIVGGAYTATFGNGYSITAAFADMKDTLAAGGTNGGGCCAGLDSNANHLGVGAFIGAVTVPDLDLVARVDQSWGSVMVGATLHQISQSVLNGTGAAAFTGATLGAPAVNVRGTGYAVMGGVKFNLPMIAAGDQLWLQAAYGVGALEAVGIGGKQGNLSYGANPFNMRGLFRNDQDAILVYNNNGTFSLERETAFSGLIAFHHYFIPDILRGNLFANYVVVTPGKQTQNTDWLAGGLSKATELNLGANLVWSPLKGLEMTAEAMHTNLWSKLTADAGSAGPSCYGTANGACNAAMMAAAKPSPSQWNFLGQVSRKF